MRLPIQQRELVCVSEISEYLFCRRSWYLAAQGVRPSAIQIDRMRAGIRRHRRHGRLVAFSQRLVNAATYVLIFTLLFAAGYWFWTYVH
jgi:CRISPR/Cas system-associated exonuclease Cas4 (RecB family)